LSTPLFQRIIIIPLPLKAWAKGEKERNEAPLGKDEEPVVYGIIKNEPSTLWKNLFG